MTKLKVYIAGPLFSVSERDFGRHLKEMIEKSGMEALWPWDLYKPEGRDERKENQIIFDTNREALNSSDLVIANLDGPDIDSGTSWEIGYAHAKGIPTVGIRTDFRLAGENPKAKVNLIIDRTAREIVSSTKELGILLKDIGSYYEKNGKVETFFK